MQQDINALSNWCLRNGIMANTDKTKVMVFGTANKLKKVPEFELRFEKTPLQQVQSYKYLGLSLDNQLNFNIHVNRLVASASSKLKQFQRMRSFLNTKAALLVYKSMLLPIMEYGDVFLSAATLANRKKLQTLQNKGLRCALNKGLEISSDDLHEEAKLYKLKFRREQHTLNLMFDWALDPGKLKTKRIKGLATRSSSKKLLRLKKPRTEKFRNCLTYLGPKKWNSLPVNMQLAGAKTLFTKSNAAWISRKVATINQEKSSNYT